MRGAKIVGHVRDGRTARRAVTRRAIMQAATTLFAAKGVTATSIDDIAELASIAKGSVFYNFGSKSGLVNELFDSYAEELSGAIAAHTEGKQGDALRTGVVHALLTELEQRTDAARVVVSELFRTERDWSTAVARWRDMATSPIADDYVREHGEQARETGQVQAAAIVGATLSAGLEWLAYRPATPREVIEAALLMTLQLPAPGPAAGAPVPQDA